MSVFALFGTGLTASSAQAVTTDEPSVTELGRRVARSMTTEPLDRTPSKPVPPKAPGTAPPKASPYIIGGTTESIANAPWMAQLHYYDDRDTADPGDDESFFCGGTVIAPTKILTAAHCVVGLDWTKDSVVVVGGDKLPTTGADNVTDWHGGTPVAVRRQWMHPSYGPVSYDNDVAVLTLSKAVTTKTLPVARSNDTALYGPGNAETYGWGRYTSASLDLSPALKKATLPLVSDDTCAAFWQNDLIRGHMVCAGSPASGSDAGTTTTCNGDSGGPLVRNGRLIGIVSWGAQGCVYQGAYAVFAKVTSYAGPIRARAADTDWSKDGRADVLARRASDGAMIPRIYYGSGLYGATPTTSGDYRLTDLAVQTDLNRDGAQDIVRRQSNGSLFRTHWVAGKGWTHTYLTNFATRRTFLAPGDVTGDDLPDLVSVRSDGRLAVHPGTGYGGFRAEIDAGPGWQAYSQVLGHGDLTGDGKADILARTPAGALYLYKGTGTAGLNTFTARVQVGTLGSSYTGFATVGDVDDDGRADLLAREGDRMWLFPGTGAATGATFATRKSMGTGWSQFDLLG
ncbi:trypsin-like serine protease [Streptomyces sp. NPDC012888]|uniref:trypsin-like serine protease n=1 Tax=Streptomyces sp. NPDC012888 TaxID=3364855 RepID=UPI0036B14A95